MSAVPRPDRQCATNIPQLAAHFFLPLTCCIFICSLEYSTKKIHKKQRALKTSSLLALALVLRLFVRQIKEVF